MKKIFCLFIMVFALCLTGCSKNPVSGNYDCYNLNPSTEDGFGSHAFDLKLNSNKTFEFIGTGFTSKGKYTYKRESKDSKLGRYYELTMVFESTIVDGDDIGASTTKWELGLPRHEDDYDAIISSSNGSIVVCKTK